MMILLNSLKFNEYPYNMNKCIKYCSVINLIFKRHI